MAVTRVIPGGSSEITRALPAKEDAGGGGGGLVARSIDLTPTGDPASPLIYTDSAFKLVGAGGILDGWRFNQYGPVPTVRESTDGVQIQAAIPSPNNVRPGTDTQWLNTGPSIYLPDDVVGDFDFKIKCNSTAADTYQMVGVSGWMFNATSNLKAGGIWTCRGGHGAANSYRWGVSIGNGGRQYIRPGALSAWSATEWLRLARVGPIVSSYYRVADSGAWTLIESQTWDRAGGTCWLGLAFGTYKLRTVDWTVHKIEATFIDAP